MCSSRPPTSSSETTRPAARPFVELAYASTVHSAQGLTVDRAVMIVNTYTQAELLYVGMTRGRTSNIAVADAGDDDGLTLFQAAVANPSADTVAAVALVDAERDRRRQEQARTAALQLVEDLAGMDPEDARAVLAQQLGGTRWHREALTALQEQQQQEQASQRTGRAASSGSRC